MSTTRGDHADKRDRATEEAREQHSHDLSLVGQTERGKHDSAGSHKNGSDGAAKSLLPELTVSGNEESKAAFARKIEQAATVKDGEGYWQSAERLLSIGGGTPDTADIASLTHTLQEANGNKRVLDSGVHLVNQSNLSRIESNAPSFDAVESRAISPETVPNMPGDAAQQKGLFSTIQKAATVKSGEGYWQSAQRLLSLGGGKPSNADIAKLTDDLQNNADLGHSVLQPKDVLIDQENIHQIIGGNTQLKSVIGTLADRIERPQTSSNPHKSSGRPGDSASLPSSDVARTAQINRLNSAAEQAYESIDKQLGDGPGKWQDRPGGPDNGVWDLSQTISALNELPKDSNQTKSDLANALSSLGQFSGGGAGYTADRGTGKNSNKWYDDNNWIGLGALQSYEKTGNKSDLSIAKQELQFAESGWDNHPGDKDLGGVFWKEDDGDRNAVSTAGAEQLALELYKDTPGTDTADRKQDLSFATKADEWMNKNLKDPTDGLYYDHVSAGGEINKSEIDYNQGLMIGNDALLYQATGSKTYLRAAQNLANTSIDKFSNVNGTSDKQSDQLALSGIYAENLAVLNSIAPSKQIKSALVNYADQASQDISADGLVANEGNHTLIDQLGVIRIEAAAADALKDQP